jgi:hypothetical protein
MPETTFDLDEIPQANDLEKVGLVVIGVSKGNRTYQAIATFIGFTERQGRYYRRAAEILGLIRSDGKNNSVLTEAGATCLNLYKRNKDFTQALKPSLSSIPLLREVYERVSNKAVIDDDDILDALIELAGVNKSNITIVRRLSTFVTWLKQAGLLEQVDNNKFRLLPIIAHTEVSMPLALDENEFLASIVPYLYVAKEEEAADWNKLLTDYLQLTTLRQKQAWLARSDEHVRFARYVIGISAKVQFDIQKLDFHVQALARVDKSHARLLIERNRSLKFVSKSISAGGTALEEYIEGWLNAHGLDFERAHLLKGSEKNVDFFVPSLKLAIESKFSKTTGTKHGGAINDLNEIAKAKRHLKGLQVGVALAGEGFERSFFASLKALHKSGALDFVLPFTSIASTNPSKLKRHGDIAVPNKADLKFESSSEMSWLTSLSEYEQGLYDAVFWLKKYSAISYLSFAAKLQTWMNQTPFALECLRLILGWSLTQLENFVISAIPEGASVLKSGEINSEHVSLLVTGFMKLISPIEIQEIEQYFESEPTTAEFIAARIEAFDGVARKKRNTSKVFVEACKAASSFPTSDHCVDLELPNATNLQSNFSVQTTSGNKNVLCKYYAGDGSVMSDLVKKIELLACSEEVGNWIIIIDGAGWKKRIADFRRLLAIARDKNVELYNLQMWKAIKPNALKGLKKHTL